MREYKNLVYCKTFNVTSILTNYDYSCVKLYCGLKLLEWLYGLCRCHVTSYSDQLGPL